MDVIPENIPTELSAALESSLKTALMLKHELDEAEIELPPIEVATLQLVTETITLALAAAELLSKSYVFPAESLTRNIVDRVSTLQHVALNGNDGLDDWKSNKLPPLAKRVQALFNFTDEEMASAIGPHVKKLHKTVHGDPERAVVNIGIWQGREKFSFGPNPTRPEQASSVSDLITSYVGIVDFFADRLFQQLKNR